MRGKGVRPVRAPADLGITPAYAGKRAVSPGGRKVLRDHPRLCGEKSPISADRCVGMGSPPPMRGKVNFPNQPASPDRITPAYAGKRYSAAGGSGRWQDHPRLCGEKRCPLWCPLRFRGSPPPMRGKEMPLGQGVLHFRITPAYAGKRCGVLSKKAMTKDHPRLCGEKSV